MNDYTAIIIATFFGFFALAAIVLIPVYRFLNKEERLSRAWTVEALAKKAQNQTASEIETDGDNT